MNGYDSIGEFLAEREMLSEGVARKADRILKRILSADSMAYGEGALPEWVKEIAGLSASMVLRCDDCIAWHVHRCRETGVTDEQFMETLGIACLVGGTITIPHIRRAVALWESRDE